MHGLYNPNNEHDGCGIGFVAHIKGERRHEIVTQGLRILENLDHRGAVGADPQMGDGAGILLQIPDHFYREEMARQGVTLPCASAYGVGMVFLPWEMELRHACEQALASAVETEGQTVLGWRDVPVDSSALGSAAVKASEPMIRQIFIGADHNVQSVDAFERVLYVIRNRAHRHIQTLNLTQRACYSVVSMSARTVVYKGLLLAHQVGAYYPDLQDARVVSALALVHQRFSTNTFPAWELAHPFRMIAHNGEINTIKGNVNGLRARIRALTRAASDDNPALLCPSITAGQSDSASFDNCLEWLVMAGYPLAHAMMMMIPEAWEKHATMDRPRRAFYEYHAALMEPWDGPAAIAFTDGRQIGATLDRNGLRPARYCITDDDRIVMASEAGALPIPDARIVQKGRLRSGQMLLVDLERGYIVDDTALKNAIVRTKPYQRWLDTARVQLELLPIDAEISCNAGLDASALTRAQKAFGYTAEDLNLILAPMAQNGEEPVGSMGDDTPLAVLSQRNVPLYRYFRQLFAQVTNPPIDPIRESLVMSLTVWLGAKPDVLEVNPTQPFSRLEMAQPILDVDAMAKLRSIDRLTSGQFRAAELDICMSASKSAAGIEACLSTLCARAAKAVTGGANLLILSDRRMSQDAVAIPALLATSAVHHYLIQHGLRMRCGVVVETGSAREVHHFALLAGYGAQAVHPYLALHTIAQRAARPPHLSVEQVIQNFIQAIGKGLYKVMSKMGISTLMSYIGAQNFEAIGLSCALIDAYFPGTSSNIGGLSVQDVAEEALRMHRAAYTQASDTTQWARTLDLGGEYAYRAQGEAHLWTPDTIAKLQHAVRSNAVQTYREYAQRINAQSPLWMTLRGLLDFHIDPAHAIPLADVEPASEIVKRFSTGAMSLGSISSEAHTALAIAMNRIGGKSNTGEGGEDARRYRGEMQGIPIQAGETLVERLGAATIVRDLTLRAGDSLRSRIKQIASGRFGVSAAYLNSADQIQIKMAQGAKPGEGGQLPGDKVSATIARLRYSIPGVGLISPPPHHDIYSIEDLAQLIHDLKNVNPAASVSVKLVSEAGVGTIAAGVAKAKADHLVIAGHDGGTGAAPLSSIKYAGAPWELGLAEVQHTLVLNRLRGRIRIQADGQMKTGRDVVIAALLGADEMGFATAPLVAQGCIMMRKCHLNTCPVGIATQDPVLRRKFQGQPEHVVNFFFFIAEEVREIMAQLGMRTFDQLVGRADLLKMKSSIDHWKAKTLDFSRLLHRPEISEDIAYRHVENQQHGLDTALDHLLIQRARDALEYGARVAITQRVQTKHRSVGVMLSGEVVRRVGPDGLSDDSIVVACQGVAGQSFGAFLARGITLDLHGEANDYVGKGLSGGHIVIRPPEDFRGTAEENLICGNTVLYGALSGEALLRGMAGERFAVRNSGATAVVEGVGDHACEYMTGGTVVVLGETGRNFAAGMSGGVAYVYDPHHRFAARCNQAMVTLESVLPHTEQARADDAIHWHHGQTDEVQLRALLERHAQCTGSQRAGALLAQWETARSQFIKVFPNDYRRVLAQRDVTSVTAEATLESASA